MEDFKNLVERARTGDDEAMNELLARFYPSVRSMVQSSRNNGLGSPAAAALFSTGDVVQEVFVAVLRELERIDMIDERTFAGYLAALVRHRLVDMLRYHQSGMRDWRRTSRPATSTDAPVTFEHPTRGPLGRAEDRELQAAFAAALAEFSEREARLLRGRIEERLEFPQLADELGYGHADTARKAYYRAQTQLLLRMRSKGIDWRPEPKA